jgi:hypothetical protein
MDVGEMGCENGKWMEVAQDGAPWWALVFPELNLRVLLSELVLCTKVT